MTDEGVRNTIYRMRRDEVIFEDEWGDGRLRMNLNDCFGWALADLEDITDKQRPYAEAYAEFGFAGCFVQAAIDRGYDPEPGHLQSWCRALNDPEYENKWFEIKKRLLARKQWEFYNDPKNRKLAPFATAHRHPKDIK